MPPDRRPRPPQPQTSRCRYVDERTKERCRRIATVGGGLCRQHALVLELELDDHSPTTSFFETIDRLMSTSRDPIATRFASFLGDFLGQRMSAHQERIIQGMNGQRPATQEQARRRPASPPAPPPDPSVRAREILGFEPGERLTVEMIQDRKRALARVFHPDMQGGSKVQMQRVLDAASVLLDKLAKPARPVVR